MADYNPNTVSAYQQYASSMKAGGGGTNLSGSGAKAPPKMQTEYGNRKGLGSPTSRLDRKGYTPTGSKSTASGVAYIEGYGGDAKNIPMTPEQIYAAAAQATTEVGGLLVPTLDAPMIHAANLYSMPNMAQQVSDYVYRADRDMAVREAISGAQQEEQDSVDAAIKSINKAITQGKTDAEIAETFLNDMGGMGNDKPDETGGFGVPGVTLKDVTDTEQGLMTNPQPLYDFAEEMANPSITTTELPPITADQKEKLGAKLREASDKGDLSSVMNQLAQDSKVQLSSAVTNFIEDAETQVASNDIDPFTGLPIGNNELGFTDVSPAEEAPDQLGLMARSRVPTGSIEEAVREAYDLEEAEAEEDVTPATTSRTNDVVDTALTKLSDNTSMSKSDIVNQVKDLVGPNIYTAAILGAFEKESGRNFTSREENLNYSLANARAVPFSKTKIDNALNSLSEEDRAKVEAGRNVEAFGKALMDESYSGGSDYKGRGLIHITHDYNYQAVGDRIGVDLVSNPELVNDPRYAVPAALAYLDLQGYFEQEPTKNSLHRMINPQASRTIKNQRWTAANRYLDQIKDEGGSSDSSPRPTLRPTE